MRRHRRSTSIAAVLTLLLLAAPVDAVAAAPKGPPGRQQEGGQGEERRADTPPPRKRPAQPPRSSGTPGRAAATVSCGQTITKNTTLTADVGPCEGNGIIIGVDNITLNLNGRRVLGNSDQGASGEFAAIRLAGRTGVTVTGHPGKSGKTATLTGFEAGVVIDGGSANTVQNLTVRDNVGRDDPFNAELGDGIVIFDSPSNRILNNVVAHNGIFDGIGVLGSASNNTTIQGNTVEGTVGPRPRFGEELGGPAGQGIIVNGADGMNLATVTGTKVESNIILRNGSAGIANINNIDATIVGNVVEGNGLTNRAGNGIGVQAGLGFRSGRATRVLVQDNEVHGNGLDGIQILDGASENRIINNDASDNNALNLPFPKAVDLRDANRNRTTFEFDCDANAWQGNTWGNAFFFPECTSTGGSGPPPPPPEPEGPSNDPTCSDGIDNDRDGFIDSLDSDSCTREGPGGTRVCGDGVDNDRDGLIDGDDPDCRAEDSPDDLDPGLDPGAP